MSTRLYARYGMPDPRPPDERVPSRAGHALGSALLGLAFWVVILGGILLAAWWAA